MATITIRKPKTRYGDWIILKNGRRIDAETSKTKAETAARFYRNYFKRMKGGKR